MSASRTALISGRAKFCVYMKCFCDQYLWEWFIHQSRKEDFCVGQTMFSCLLGVSSLNSCNYGLWCIDWHACAYKYTHLYLHTCTQMCVMYICIYKGAKKVQASKETISGLSKCDLGRFCTSEIEIQHLALLVLHSRVISGLIFSSY